MFKQYKLRNYNFKLILLCLALSLCGVVAIGSVKESLQMKQLMGVVGGLAVMVVASFIDYKFVLKFYWALYIISIILLVLPFTPLGQSGGGATRWINLGFRFQPSEAAKILLILFFAQFIMEYRSKVKTFKFLCVSLALIILPWALIFKQPDLSTSITVLAVLCILLFIGGIDYRFVIGAIAIIVPLFVIGFYYVQDPNQKILEDYHRDRIMAYVDPESYPDLALQQTNSVTAIASGQLDGKGYRNNEISSLKNGNYIIEGQTDFIFAVIGEEFGFKGSLVVILLIFAIAFECFKIGRRMSDLSGALIATGMGSLIAVQGFFNLGVTTFLLPNTGLPLPFVSYGLTSLLSLFFGMGLVLNVRLQEKNFKKKDKF